MSRKAAGTNSDSFAPGTLWIHVLGLTCAHSPAGSPAVPKHTPLSSEGVDMASKIQYRTAVIGIAVAVASGAAIAQATWSTAGHDLKNSRHQADEKKISPKTVGRLQVKWQLTTSGDVTANPAVEGDYLYFPDSAGF